MRITFASANEHQQHMFNEELTKIIFQLLSNNIKYTLYLSGLLHFSCMTVGFYFINLLFGFIAVSLILIITAVLS